MKSPKINTNKNKKFFEHFAKQQQQQQQQQQQSVWRKKSKFSEKNKIKWKKKFTEKLISSKNFCLSYCGEFLNDGSFSKNTREQNKQVLNKSNIEDNTSYLNKSY